VRKSGILGEDSNGIPNNLMSYVIQVALSWLSQLAVFGNDYPTRDGTGVRDYIRVADLAAGHVAALGAIEQLPAVSVFNLGTRSGAGLRAGTGPVVPYRIAPRRLGDVAVSDDVGLSKTGIGLGWRATLDLDTMCRDAWRWEQWQAEHAAEL